MKRTEPLSNPTLYEIFTHLTISGPSTASLEHLFPGTCSTVLEISISRRENLRALNWLLHYGLLGSEVLAFHSICGLLLQELCLHHECITIRANAAPVNPKPSFCFMNCPQVSGGPPSNDSAPHRPHPHPHPPPEAGHLNSKSAFFRVAEKRFQYLSAQNSSVAKFADPALFKEDSEGRVSRATTNTWFCDGMSRSSSDPICHNSFPQYRDRDFLIFMTNAEGEHESSIITISHCPIFFLSPETMIKFKARVEAATGMVAGQKEDEYAHCEWMRFGVYFSFLTST